MYVFSNNNENNKKLKINILFYGDIFSGRF